MDCKLLNKFIQAEKFEKRNRIMRILLPVGTLICFSYVTFQTIQNTAWTLTDSILLMVGAYVSTISCLMKSSNYIYRNWWVTYMQVGDGRPHSIRLNVNAWLTTTLWLLTAPEEPIIRIFLVTTTVLLLTVWFLGRFIKLPFRQ